MARPSERLRRIAARSPERFAAALYREALIEEGESRVRTPVLYGTLRGSHETHDPVIDGREISVMITVGGPTRESPEGAGYAAKVHYDLDADHRVGQALFLESTLMESARFLPERVARRAASGWAT